MCILTLQTKFVRLYSAGENFTYNIETQESLRTIKVIQDDLFRFPYTLEHSIL